MRIVFVLVVSLLLGCKDGQPSSDSGSTDLLHQDQVLIADHSVAPCDSSLSLSPSSLSSDFCVARRVQLPLSPGAFAAAGDQLWTFTGISSSTELKGEVKEWTIPPSGQLVDRGIFFDFSVPISAKAFLGEYLAISPSGGRVAVGYTLDKTFQGTVFWGGKGSTHPLKLAQAQGNYDAVLLDDKTLLINGFGLEAAQRGQGVYLAVEGLAPRLLIKDLGTMSGPVARGANVLFAGGYFASGSKIYGFTLAEIRAAIASGKEISAATDGDLIYSGSALDAATLGDDLVLARANPTTFALEAVSQLPVMVSGSSLTAAAEKDLVTPGGGVTVERLASAGNRVGLILKNGTTVELALIQRK